MLKEKSLGEKIKYYRQLKKLNQLDIEISTKMSIGHLSRIENNQVNPSKETLLRIGKVLKLKTSELQYLFDLQTDLPPNLKEGTVKSFSYTTELMYDENLSSYSKFI